MLEGRPIQDARPLLTAFYSEKDIETPGIKINGWMMALNVEVFLGHMATLRHGYLSRPLPLIHVSFIDL